MALPSNALTTLSRVKGRLPNVAAGYDGVLEELIAACSSFIEQTCKRSFLRSIKSNELYDGVDESGTRKTSLLLMSYPVTAVASVELRQSRSPEVWETLDTGLYDIDLTRGILFFQSPLPVGFRNVRITYTAGYLIDFANATNAALHTLPADLSLACEKMAVREFHKRDHAGESSRGIGSDQIVWLDNIDSDIMRCLATHIRLEF